LHIHSKHDKTSLPRGGVCSVSGFWHSDWRNTSTSEVQVQVHAGKQKSTVRYGTYNPGDTDTSSCSLLLAASHIEGTAKSHASSSSSSSFALSDLHPPSSMHLTSHNHRPRYPLIFPNSILYPLSSILYPLSSILYPLSLSVTTPEYHQGQRRKSSRGANSISRPAVFPAQLVLSGCCCSREML